MTTSHLREKGCRDISWVVLTQSLVIWWKKMERGQATVGNCCTRAFFSFAARVKSYACPNSLLIAHFDLRPMWWCKGHRLSYFSCVIFLHLKADKSFELNSSYWPYCHGTNIHSARWDQPFAPDCLANPNTVPMVPAHLGASPVDDVRCPGKAPSNLQNN